MKKNCEGFDQQTICTETKKGDKVKIISKKISEITVAEPFVSLFPITEGPYESIKIDIEKNGFDGAFPIIVWEEKNVIVDGHTRFNAAVELDLAEIPVLVKNFENEDDAILYAFHLQRNRRNLADEDILRCLNLLDTIKAPDSFNEKGKKATTIDNAAVRAKELGTSKSKIEKARKVLNHANDDIKEAVSSGEKTINKAFNEMQDMRRESGELKGRITTGLASGSNYNKAFGRYIIELKRMKEDGWREVSRENIILDLETITNLIG